MRYLIIMALPLLLAACGGDTSSVTTGANSTVNIDGSSGTVVVDETTPATAPEGDVRCSTESREANIC